VCMRVSLPTSVSPSLFSLAHTQHRDLGAEELEQHVRRVVNRQLQPLHVVQVNVLHHVEHLGPCAPQWSLVRQEALGG
jgi:hypothetical protein